MLNRGLYCLMKFCSASSASASVCTTSASTWSIIGRRSRPARVNGERKRDESATDSRDSRSARPDQRDEHEATGEDGEQNVHGRVHLPRRRIVRHALQLRGASPPREKRRRELVTPREKQR